MKFVRRNAVWIANPIILAAFFLIWHYYIVIFGVSKFILPSPLAVFGGLWELMTDPDTFRHASITVYEALVGFAIASVTGVLTGAVLGKVPWLERTLNTYIVAAQVVPKIALIPLFILWFGFGPESKIVIAAVLAFFPIFTNTLFGIKSVDLGHRDVMTSLNASRTQTFWTLEFPSSLPAILTGMEVGIVLATIGAVVGEYLGGNVGLGHLAVATLNAYEVDSLFAVITLLTFLGFVMYLGVIGARRIIVPWHESVMVERRPPEA
jgi:NitT/TauT family transport system permease protein